MNQNQGRDRTWIQLVVPGVGPVIAIGALAATRLGVAGAAAGVVAGESLKEALVIGLPHEDVYVYEEALRRGRSVVVALAEEGAQSQQARETMLHDGSQDLEALRENWWRNLREKEREHYQTSGRDFESR